MRYSLEPKYRKYVPDYGFLSFARKFGDKYGKKIMDSATKTATDAAKTASERVVQRTAEATRDLIRNKIANKITSAGRGKKDETNGKEEVYIPPEKRQQIIDDLRLFWCNIKMENQKITNVLSNTPDKVPTFITKKLIKVYEQSGGS